MLAQLGDIRFEGLNTPRSWSESHETTFGEIKHLGGKPSLQVTGEELVNIDLSIRLSKDFGDPSQSIELMKVAKTSAEILPLITGTGILVGRFVITTLDVVVEKTKADGELLSALLTLSLKEYVSPPGSEDKQPVSGEAISGDASARQPQPPADAIITEPREITNDIAAATLNANNAKSTLKDIQKGTKKLKAGVKDIKQLAGTAKLFYTEAKTKLLQTVKIAQRATQLPMSLDEAIDYADNLARVDNLVNLTELGTRTGQLSTASENVTKHAAPVVAFVSTREGGK